jgi:hypothetical protein
MGIKNTMQQSCISRLTIRPKLVDDWREHGSTVVESCFTDPDPDTYPDLVSHGKRGCRVQDCWDIKYTYSRSGCRTPDFLLLLLCWNENMRLWSSGQKEVATFCGQQKVYQSLAFDRPLGMINCC